MEGKGKQLIAKNELRNQEDVQSALKNRETSIYVGQFVKGEKSGFGNFKWSKNY